MLGARSTLGLFRGLNTFAQLWFSYRCGGGGALDRDGEGGVVLVYTLSAPVAIKDSPAYVSFFLVSWGADMGGD